MGRLLPEQVTAYEDHYVTCAACATILQEAAEYAEAMRAATLKLRST